MDCPRIERSGLVELINRDMKTHGLRIATILVSPGGNYNFSRESASLAVLTMSYDLVASELGARGVAIPVQYKVGVGNQLVGLSAGIGFTGDDTNPNPQGMGLVSSSDMYGVAHATTFSDAAAATIVHIPTGLTVTISGIWYLLAQGTLHQALRLLRTQIMMKFAMFLDVRDLYVIMSPGARADSFYIDGVGKLHGAVDFLRERYHPVNDREREQFAAMSDVFVTGDRVFKLTKPFEQKTASRTRLMTYAFDSSGFFYDLLVAAGIPEGRIDFDPRNNMTHEENGVRIFPSARKAQETGKKSDSSGVLATVVFKEG